MSNFTSGLALAGLALTTQLSQAQPLLWGYSPADPAPYVIVRNNDLQAGLTHDIGIEVAAVVERDVIFVATPNNRIEESLANGRINIICNTQPTWLDSPTSLLWTKSLYEDADVIITRLDTSAPASLGQLKGAIVGTTQGYHYSPQATLAFEQQLITRHDVRDLPTRLKMLERGRLDAAIDLRRAVKHLLPTGQTSFRISNWAVETFSLQCAITNPTEDNSQRLAQSIDQMIEDGRIQRIVQRFD